MRVYNDDKLNYYAEKGKQWLISRDIVSCDDELFHYGVKGMKWGVRRFQNKDGSLTPVGRKKHGDGDTTLSQISPKIKDTNGDYIYRKGTVVGRYGKQQLDDTPMYLFTNEKDRNVYSNYLGGEEQRFVVKKSIKIPTETKQLVELYKYTKDPDVLNDPYYYWKEHINQGGPIADGFFKFMRDNGYNALVDVRNSGGVSDDPILLLNPKECLIEVKKK